MSELLIETSQTTNDNKADKDKIADITITRKLNTVALMLGALTKVTTMKSSQQ